MDNFQQWRAAMLGKVGAYWDAAFREGRNGSGCEADAANCILHGDGGIEALMQAHQAALAELQLYRALCEGYTLEELQRMSLTFKAQVDVLRGHKGALTGGAVAIAEERRRQIYKENWTAEHDDQYSRGQLALAAACYAMSAVGIATPFNIPHQWPWAAKWWKPSTPRRDLVKAGALCAAAIEQIDRAGEKGKMR